MHKSIKTLGIRLIQVHALKNNFVFQSMTIMMFQRLLYLMPFVLNRISMYMCHLMQILNQFAKLKFLL